MIVYRNMHAVQPYALLTALIMALIPAVLALAQDEQADAGHLTHELCPERDCGSSVVRFVEAFRSGDRSDLARLIDFPVFRGYPVVAPIQHDEFGARFDDLFDQELAEFIFESDLDDWEIGGWRGVLLRGPRGIHVWLHHDGSLRGVYGGWRPAWIAEWHRLIELERSQLHPSLHEYARPILDWETESHRIRIDSLAGGSYRYASWKVGAPRRRKPNLLLHDGRLFGHGGCGNHQYDFATGEYLYQVMIHSCDGSTTPGELFVYRLPGGNAAPSFGAPPPDDYELLRREPFIRTPNILEELAIGARRRTE